MNPIKLFVEKIMQLIAKDNLQEAIQAMQQLLKGSPSLDELLLQSARYNDIIQQIRLGTVDFQNAAIEKIKSGMP